jgi:enoyl-CoA hydratase/carnithine racemase
VLHFKTDKYSLNGNLMNNPSICDAIHHELHEGVLRVVFNRAQQRNALTFEMYLQLAWLFTRAREDSEVRVVLLSGAGGYFSAGNDLNDFLEFSADDEFVPAHFLRALSRCDKPIVAAVEGGAIGVGATMLLHCDVVYAAMNAKFLMPFINFGLCPEGGSSLLMPRNAGYKQAVRWLMLGEQFAAPEACAAGLVTEVVPDGEAMTKALRTVQRLLSLAPLALQQTKRLMRRPDSETVQETIEVECAEFVQLLASPPAQEALSAFAARRG